MILLAIVLALIIFGLGYVIGKAKAKLIYFDQFNLVKDQLMFDGPYQKSIIDKMMGDDASRLILFQKVDDYRNMMRKK